MRLRTPLRAGRLLAALGFAALLAAPGAAQRRAAGDPFAPLGLERLADLATSVVVGTIESAEGEWNYDRTRIHTRFTLDVERVLAGRASGKATFRVLGGTVGETTVMVSEMPRFSIGERVVVFLRGSGGRLPSVVGGPEGKIALDAGPGEEDGEHALRLLAPLRVPAADPARADTVIGALDELEEFLRGRRRN